ncbi:MAG: hypothetical protein A2309_14775 [Bacteroidetes bacterium RIFOXYB2_FULL_35_7]|nr:MAG: hypothetical protein A2309_14775 [Bacteroidetes bacterium RIFOXYB2_FULL_35_7]
MYWFFKIGKRVLRFFYQNSAKRHHRNMYVFSAYAGGLRIFDVLQLKWENFDGERVLVTTQKTGSVVSVKLPAKALEIVNSYKTGVTKPSDFVFPLLKNDVDYSDPAVLYDAISSMNAYTNKNLKKGLTGLQKGHGRACSLLRQGFLFHSILRVSILNNYITFAQ